MTAEVIVFYGPGWLTGVVCATTMRRMRGIRLLLFVAVLAVVLFAGTADSSAPSGPCGVEEAVAATATDEPAGDDGRQASTRVSITMTGEEAENDSRQASVGIGITMTGRTEEGNG